MREFFKSLLSGDESEVDSVICFGALALLVLLAVTVYAVAIDHTSWSPVAFSSSVLSLIGGTAGSKRLRDGPATAASTAPTK